MQFEQKKCSITTHQQNYITHICTFRSCNINQKLLCQYCLEENIHKHDMTNNDHILDDYQFKTQILKEFENLEDRQSYSNQSDSLKVNMRKLRSNVNHMIDDLKQVLELLSLQFYDDYKYGILKRAIDRMKNYHCSQLNYKQLLNIEQDYKLQFTSTFQQIDKIIIPIKQELNESIKIVETVASHELDFNSNKQKLEVNDDQFYQNCILIQSNIKGDYSVIERVIQTCLRDSPDRLSSYISGNILATNIEMLYEYDSNYQENVIMNLVAHIYVICKKENLVLKSEDNKKVFEDQRQAIWEYLVNIVDRDTATNVFHKILNYHKQNENDV